jgi:hypothetical protein
MYYEKLALEVNATIAGLEVVKPAALKGKSGVTHRFAFLASDGKKNYAFEICSEVGEIEVLRAFVKRIDTDAEVFIVCLSGRAREQGKELASIYKMDILTPKEVGEFFSRRITQLMHVPEVPATT